MLFPPNAASLYRLFTGSENGVMPRRNDIESTRTTRRPGSKSIDSKVVSKCLASARCRDAFVQNRRPKLYTDLL